jgi:hypothetical protein
MQKDPKQNADGGVDPEDLLEREHLIDPGNEHNHLEAEESAAGKSDAEPAQTKGGDQEKVDGK